MEEKKEKKETVKVNEQEILEKQESEKKESEKQKTKKQESEISESEIQKQEEQESEKKESEKQKPEKQESEKSEFEIQKPEKNESEKNDLKVETKSSKSKGKKTTKIIIAIVLLIVIFAVAGFGAYFYFVNNNKLDWGKLYLKVLEDDDKKLEQLEDRKIQLLDLDKNNIPELIVYGIEDDLDHIADIFKINDKKQIDTIKVEFNDEFDFKLLYNTEKDDYFWYTVVENKANSTEDQNQKTVYDLNINAENNESEKLDVNFDLDIVEVEDNYSKKVDLKKDLSKKEIEDIFEEAKEEYVETENMITDEVKAEVEKLKVYKNVKRPDKSKGLVYSALKYENKYGNKYEYPIINIDSEDVKRINNEIKENYGFSEEEKESLLGMELTEISYSYNVKDNYLSLIVKKGGNQSVWGSSYVINLDDCTKLTPEALLEKLNLNKSEIISKVKEVALKDYNSQIEKEKNSMGNYAWQQLGYDKSDAEWKSNLEKNVNELKNIFFNQDGDLCLIVEYEHPGGQWACTKSLIINISNGYSVKELTLNNGEASNPTFEKMPEPTSTPPQTTESKPTQTQNSSSNSSNSDILPVKTTMSKITFSNNPTTTAQEGVYKRNSGKLTITNSKKGSFDFKIECSWMTAAGYPNLGELSGTAKETTNGNFAYVEKKSEGAYYDYNVIFYLVDGGVQIQDEATSGFSPYCGHNVLLGGLYLK